MPFRTSPYAIMTLPCCISAWREAGEGRSFAEEGWPRRNAHPLSMSSSCSSSNFFSISLFLLCSKIASFAFVCFGPSPLKSAGFPDCCLPAKILIHLKLLVTVSQTYRRGDRRRKTFWPYSRENELRSI